MTIAIIPLILGIILFVLLFLVVQWATAQMGLDVKIRQIIYVLLVVLFVFWLISQLGIMPGVVRVPG